MRSWSCWVASEVCCALLAFGGIASAATPPGHIVMGIGADVCGLQLPGSDRENFYRGTACVGHQWSRQVGLQVQGDTWQHEIESNLLVDNARDLHWHGWSAVPCVSYSPRGGHWTILGGAGVGFADFDGYSPDLTRLALLLGVQYEFPVGSLAVVPRLQIQRLSASSLNNPETISLGFGIQWY